MRAAIHLRAVLDAYLADKGYEWPKGANIEPPRDKQFGDLATNLAMTLAKQARTNPRAIAVEIKEAIEASGPEIAEVDIAGPGFINCTFAPSFWQQGLVHVLEQGESFGRSDAGKGKKVQVEYVSANPTGPLHIGHGRGAALGDALARILKAAGYEADTEYYVNDAGRQMRILGMSILVRARQEKGLDESFPDDHYQGGYIRDLALEVLDRHPDLLDKPEAEALDVCREYGMNSILDGIKRDLEAFGVEHRVWFSEKSLVDSGSIERTFERLREKGLAYDKDGALWFKSTEFGDDKDRVLVKSGGDLTYFASDIAYHDDKYGRGFDLVVNIWGADHHGYVSRLKGAVQALGKSADSLEVILVQLVNLLRGGEPVAMSTRAGEFVTLDEVVREVGADAARFMFLSRKSDSPLDFDLELVKQKSMENPVYYVQYAHARICSVMRKAEERGVVPAEPGPEALALLDTPEDLELFKLMDRLPEVVASAARNLSPHQVSFYLRELAGALHRYYTVNQILGAEDDALKAARLLMVQAVARVVANGLGVLGVGAPERM